jgi:hypothetical protein
MPRLYIGIRPEISSISVNELSRFMSRGTDKLIKIPHSARRFFRLFKWIDCFNAANNLYAAYMAPPASAGGKENQRTSSGPAPAKDGFHLVLLILKWSLLGAYLFLEFFTTSDAITGTWRPWTLALQIESLKFWFYALSVSVVLDLYEIFFVFPASAAPKPVPSTPAAGGEKASSDIPGSKSSSTDKDALTRLNAKRRSLYRQLVIDSCDLIIPGAAVGWLHLDPVTVGIAGTVSALAGGSEAWERLRARS